MRKLDVDPKCLLSDSKVDRQDHAGSTALRKVISAVCWIKMQPHKKFKEKKKTIMNMCYRTQSSFKQKSFLDIINHT